jgi:hypothetical protein
LGLTVSCNDPLLTRAESRDPIRNYPGGFVIMAERAGIPFLPSFINAIQILAAFSVATVNLFVAVPCSLSRIILIHLEPIPAGISGRGYGLVISPNRQGHTFPLHC